MSKKIIVLDRSEGNKVSRTAQGFLRVDGYVTKTGVLKYRTADGKVIKQLRDPREVFNSDSLETLKSLPVTLRHPPKLVTPKDVKQYMVGYSSDEVSKSGPKLKTQLTITDEAAINSVESGETIELSCGYECELDEAPGTYDGQEYDFVQRNIKYNHIALVDKGRAGPDVRILMDAAEDSTVYIQDDLSESTQEETKMEKVMIEGKEFEASPELAAALKAHMEKMAAMQSELDGMKEKAPAMDEMKKDKEAMQAKMDAMSADLEKAKTDLKANMDSVDEKAIEAKVRARFSLIETAKRFVAKDAKIDEMSDVEIKKAVIKSDLPNVVLDGKSDEYVAASFDYIVERTKAADEKLANLGKKMTSQNKDADVGSPEEARKRAMERAASAWKQDLPAKAKQ